MIKKYIVLLVSIFLFIMFLIYSGFFRDYTNPTVVTNYYFDCLKNREAFLTYQICKSKFFSVDKTGTLYSKYRMQLIDKIETNLLDIDDKYAQLEDKIFYKDNRVSYAIVELEKFGKSWLIKDIKYKN